MSSSKKVLTVTYGAFSCTLEGFDDPLATMKAVTEYFRGIAADDPFFGAALPAAGTGLASHIAEREIGRQIEAHIDDDGVVVRAGSTPDDTVTGALAARAGAALPPAPSGSISDKLSRIRAVVAAAGPAQEYEEGEGEFGAAPMAPASDFGFELDYGDLRRKPASADADGSDEDAAADDASDDDGAGDATSDDDGADDDGALLAGVQALVTPQAAPEEPEEEDGEGEIAPGEGPLDLSAWRMVALPGDADDRAADDRAVRAGDEGGGEPDEDEALFAGIDAALDDSGLSPEAEDELIQELADIAREGRRDPHEGRAILEANAEDDEASVERLMEQAKSKLEGVESRRRYSAISHLKAAVAATVADRILKPNEAPISREGGPAEEMELYRDDLSKAVRPRRPSPETAATTRRPLIETRPAPLVLVSEQRVDMPLVPPKTGAVRPRRIQAVGLAASQIAEEGEDLDSPLSPEDARSFAEFAERLGAESLSDMLEAAAAYTATVEGQSSFSRPQIMRKVALAAEVEDFSREDGLRSFGLLLRQGKFQKISRGQFKLTETSRFMTEARRQN